MRRVLAAEGLVLQGNPSRTVLDGGRPLGWRLVWHALGAKTIDLDAQTIEDLMTGKRMDISDPTGSRDDRSSMRSARGTPTSSSPALTSCANCCNLLATRLLPRRRLPMCRARAGQGRAHRTVRGPQGR